MDDDNIIVIVWVAITLDSIKRCNIDSSSNSSKNNRLYSASRHRWTRGSMRRSMPLQNYTALVFCFGWSAALPLRIRARSSNAHKNYHKKEIASNWIHSEWLNNDGCEATLLNSIFIKYPLNRRSFFPPPKIPSIRCTFASVIMCLPRRYNTFLILTLSYLLLALAGVEG